MLGKSRENARRKVLRAHERPVIARACFIIFRSRVARAPNGWKFVNATWRANGSRHVNATRDDTLFFRFSRGSSALICTDRDERSPMTVFVVVFVVSSSMERIPRTPERRLLLNARD